LLFRRKSPQPPDPYPLTLADADVWAMRDIGFVDPEWRDLLGEGGVLLDYDIEPTVEQKQQVIDRYREIAAHLNKTKMDGRRDWTPRQAWSLGRAAIAASQGIDPEVTKTVVPWPRQADK
jgi:hypothetical protein